MNLRSGSVSKEKKRGKLYFTMGLPKSGKSTYCNEWVLNQSPANNPRVVISGDDFRAAITGREFQAESENLVFATMDTAIRALLNRGFDVIVDETSSTPETLRRYFRIDRLAIAVIFDTSEDVCILRAINDRQEYLIPHIKRIARQMAITNNKDVMISINEQVQERLDSNVSV